MYQVPPSTAQPPSTHSLPPSYPPTPIPADPLFQLLRPERLTAVVDIGANPIDSQPPYHGLLRAGLCTLVGFEPQRAALELLQQRKGPREMYLPHAIGDGSMQTLHVCRGTGMTSLLKPDPRSLALFRVVGEAGRVVGTEVLPTRTLDSVEEVRAIDLLKIDVQGSELAVFRSGRAKLAGAVAVQTEVSWFPLYENQPTIGDIDLELRGQGFLPHAMADLKRWTIAPLVVANDPRRPLNQLLESDLVYVRDIRTVESWTDEQLRHMAMIAHHCYRSFDLALHCMVALERRGRLALGIQQRYLGMLPRQA